MPDRVRIALFTYATQPRGGVLHALALGEALYALGHEVVLHALDDSGRGFVRPPRCPSVVVPVDASRANTMTYVKRCIDAYVDSWNPATPAFDVYHAQDGISGNALATLVERAVIPHFTRTVHHLDDFGASALTALQDRSIRSARDCFVVSRVWGEQLAAAYGIHPQLVPNGVDCDRFQPLAPAGRARLRIELGYGSGPLFVTIGGIEARKNTLALLDAFALVHKQLPAARLIVAGGASIFTHCAYRAAFDERVAALGVAAQVSITGVLRDDQIVALLQAAQAFVFPSLIEGFGLVVLEALACAAPVITSAIPPFSEFLTPSDALLIDPCDPSAIAAAMLHALDPDVAAGFARRGVTLARRFTWDASARAHIRAYSAGAGARELMHA